jgi:hypothetical protein
MIIELIIKIRNQKIVEKRHRLRPGNMSHDKANTIVHNYEIGICCFSAKYVSLRSECKDWLAWNQDCSFDIKKHSLSHLSTIFQLYCGCQFYWWRKPEYPEKTTDMPNSLKNIFTPWNN